MSRDVGSETFPQLSHRQKTLDRSTLETLVADIDVLPHGGLCPEGLEFYQTLGVHGYFHSKVCVEHLVGSTCTSTLTAEICH